jgi:hypothetical protein
MNSRRKKKRESRSRVFPRPHATFSHYKYWREQKRMERNALGKEEEVEEEEWA